MARVEKVAKRTKRAKAKKNSAIQKDNLRSSGVNRLVTKLVSEGIVNEDELVTSEMAKVAKQILVEGGYICSKCAASPRYLVPVAAVPSPDGSEMTMQVHCAKCQGTFFQVVNFGSEDKEPAVPASWDIENVGIDGVCETTVTSQNVTSPIDALRVPTIGYSQVIDEDPIIDVEVV